MSTHPFFFVKIRLATVDCSKGTLAKLPIYVEYLSDPEQIKI